MAVCSLNYRELSILKSIILSANYLELSILKYLYGKRVLFVVCFISMVIVNASVQYYDVVSGYWLDTLLKYMYFIATPQCRIAGLPNIALRFVQSQSTPVSATSAAAETV